MLRAGFEPAIPAIKRPQTYALDSAATGIGGLFRYREQKYKTQIRVVDINKRAITQWKCRAGVEVRRRAKM
jgi:hypothetical protein